MTSGNGDPVPAGMPVPPPITRRGSVFGLLVSSVVGQALLLATAPLVARALGPTGRGYVALVAVYDDASTALFNLGLPLAIGYFAKEGLHSAGRLLGSARRYGFLALPASLAVAVAAVIWPLRSLPPSTRLLAFVLLAQSPLVNTLGISARQLLLSRGDLAGIRVLAPLTNGLRLLLLLAALAAGRLTVPYVIAATAIAGYAANVYAWRRCRERLQAAVPLRPLLAFGVKVMPGQLADLANSRLDQLLVAPYLGAADLGIYAVAAAVTTVPTMVGTSLAWDAFSRVSRSDLAGRTNPASAAIRRAWLACSGVALAAAVIVVLLFVPIFGEAYRRGQAAALILLVGSVALAVNLVAQQVAIALGRPQYVSWSQALGFAVTVAGLPFAIPTLGIGGAALVSTIAYSARLGLMLVLLRRDGATHIAPRWQDTVELARSVRQRLSGLRAPTPT